MTHATRERKLASPYMVITHIYGHRPIVINSKDIKLKALIIMRYCKNYSSIREGMQAAMSIETLLQAVASSGNGHDSILAIQCSHRFNLHSLVVTRESIWRLCGEHY